ncbi:MAG: hypothetical protein U9N44_00880 [Chloroflexota bacterium]|nr:hypothetical protein [Chloroflexota bacterium]
MLNQQSIEPRRCRWINGITIILGIALCFLIPIAAPVFGAALITIGVYANRPNTDKVIRRLGLVAIITGVVMVVGFAIFLLLTLPAHTGINGVLIAQ